MGEGASRLQTGLQAFKWEPAGGRGREGAGSGAAEAGGEKMAREAAFLRDLGWAVGGGRTRAGRPPTEKAGTEAWEWGGLGGGVEPRGLLGLEKKDPPPRAFWERLQKIYNRRITPPCSVGHLCVCRGGCQGLSLSALLRCHQLMII